LARITGEVQAPRLISNSIVITREKFGECLEMLKVVSTENFNSRIEYTEHEVENWIVNYVNKNEDIRDTLHQLLIDHR
jgi:hypothetical protein